jgi:hypothetical protein
MGRSTGRLLHPPILNFEIKISPTKKSQKEKGVN